MTRNAARTENGTLKVLKVRNSLVDKECEKIRGYTLVAREGTLLFFKVIVANEAVR